MPEEMLKEEIVEEVSQDVLSDQDVAVESFMDDAGIEYYSEDEEGNYHIIDSEQDEEDKSPDENQSKDSEKEKTVKKSDEEKEAANEESKDEEQDNTIKSLYDGLYSEDGNINIEKALGIVGANEAQQTQQQVQQPVTEPKIESAPEKPFYEQVWDDIQKERDDVSNNVLAILNEVKTSLAQQGIDGTTALNAAYNATMDKMKNYFDNKTTEAHKLISERSLNETNEKARMQKLDLESSRNLVSAVNQLGGEKQFDDLVVKDKLGAGFIKNQFFASKYSKDGKAPTNADVEKWYKEYTANPENVKFMVNYHKGVLAQKMMPQILKQHKAMVEQEVSRRNTSKISAPRGILKSNGGAKQLTSQAAELNKHFGFDIISEV